MRGDLLKLDESSRQLLTVAGLPLVDGVFATLLVSGSISGISSILSFALTVFAGAGSLAILFSESENRRDARRMVYSVTPYLFSGALLVALLAPVFNQVFAVSRLQYVAGAVLMLIALKLARVELVENIKTHWILVPGMILSLQSFSFSGVSLNYVVPALATVSAACASLMVFSFARDVELDLGMVRRGSSLVLMVFSASMFGFNVPGQTGLTLFAASVVGSVVAPRVEFQVPRITPLMRQRFQV